MAGEPTIYYLVIEFTKVADQMEPRFVEVTTDYDKAVAAAAVRYQTVVLQAELATDPSHPG